MIEIVPYRETWPARFAEIGADVRAALGASALAIHHIGSTSVPGLAAKDVIDIQVSVADLAAPFEAALEPLGLSRQPHTRDHCPPGMTLAEPALEKRLYSCAEPRVNLHLRVPGRFNGRYALLCRDYLRAHPLAAAAYGEVKRALARRFHDVGAYYEVKDPVFDILMAGAEDWVQIIGWTPPPSDA